MQQNNLKYKDIPSYERVRIDGFKKVNAIKDGFLILISIISLFFILPRYKLVILPIQIILSAFSVNYLLNKLTLGVKKIID